MNLLLALLMLAPPPAQPRVYYYNGRNLVYLRTVEMPNTSRAVLRFFVYSPYELRDASVDSSNADMCLPDIPTRKELRLEGRWYTITWKTDLSTGSSHHFIRLYSYHRKTYLTKFMVNVEGSERAKKPSGAN